MRARSPLPRLAAAAAAVALLAASGALRPGPAAHAADAEDAALARARRLLEQAILIDGHNDLPWAIRQHETAPRDVAAYDLRKRTSGDTDLARLKEGGVGGQFWSVYVPAEDAAAGYARVQLEQIDIARRVIASYPEQLALALTADDVEREFRRGRVASLLGMEGGHALENSLGALRAYHELGVRYMTLTHNRTLDWADAAGDAPRHSGLTRFGEEVVREMNRLGMLVDLSHVTPETMDDALRVSEAPVIFSHSSARALCNVPRNVPDAVLQRVTKNGGVVMVTFVAGFVSQEFADATGPLWAEYRRRTRELAPGERQRVYREMMASARLPRVTIGQVADHVEHVRKLAGADHVGLGGDFDGNEQWPEGLDDVSRYPYLFAELIRRGWSDADLTKLAGANVLRALRGAEAVAKRLQASRPASNATIEQLDGPRATSPGRSR
jgi:membrane dipeptidase